MIKLLSVLIVLFTYSNVFALSPLFSAGTIEGMGGGTDCDSGWDICQNFETATTGYDNSETWSESGTVEAADTTRVLRGAQSLYMSNDTTTTTSPTFTAHTDNTSTYAFFRLNVDANSTDHQIIFRFYDGAQSIGYLTWHYINENISFYHGGNGAASSVGFSYDTTYYIWLRWKSETVTLNDGEYQVWLGTSGTFSSATLIIDGSNGTSDYPGLDKVVVLTDNGLDFWMDQIIVDNSAIGDVPN